MPGYDVESWHNIIEVIFAILNAIYYKKLILKNGVPFFSPQSLNSIVKKHIIIHLRSILDENADSVKNVVNG